MRKIAIPAAISLLALLAVVLWMFFSTTDGPPPPSETASEVASPVSEDVESVSTGASRSSGDVTTANAEPDNETLEALEGPTLSGTVTDEVGRPLAAASVFLRRQRASFFRDRERLMRTFRERALGRSSPVGSDSAVVETTSDAQGRYSFLIASIPEDDYQVFARSSEYAAANQSWKWVDEPSVIDFRLTLGETITGIVLDRNDRPIGGATVEAASEERGRRFSRSRSLADRTKADVDGRFTLSVSAGIYRVSAEAHRYTRNSVSDVAVGTEAVVVVLDPASAVSGRVVDEEGEPIADAIIALYSGRNAGGRDGRWRRRSRSPARTSERSGTWRWWTTAAQEQKTDGQGGFRFDNVPADRFYVVAAKPGYVTGQWGGDLSSRRDGDGASDDGPSEDTGTVDDQSAIEVRLDHAGLLAGVVTDPGGEPVGSALVALAPYNPGGDRNPWERRRRDSGTEEADSWPEPVSFFRLEGAVETDPDGSFSFNSIAAGTYSLSVQSDQHPVYRADEVELTKKDESQHDVVMEDGVSLRGRVRSSRTQDSIANAQLSFRLSERERRSVKTDDEGHYEIKGLFPRDIGEVHVTADNYSVGMFEALEVLEKPSTQEFNFELEPAARVEGKVVDRHGTPVFNARVSMTPLLDGDFTDRDGARRIFRQTMTQNKRATTDVDGVFKLDDLSGGLSFQVAVEHAEFKRHQSVEITIDPGEELKEVELVLERGARIEVLVLAPDGVAVPGARVRAELQRTEGEPDARRERRRSGGESEDENSRRSRESRQRYEDFVRNGGRSSSRRRRNTGPDGKAIFSGIDAGQYSISVESTGHQPFYTQTAAVDDDIATVIVDLLPEKVITGVIQDSDGRPVERAEVRARREVDGTSAEPRQERGRRRSRDGSTTRSDAEGAFRLGSLAEGTFSLRIRARGFSELEMEAVETDSHLPIVLERLGGVSGWVVTAETGAAIPAFKVRLQERKTRDGNPTEGRGSRLSNDLRRWRFVDDPGGVFALEEVPPGEYTLELIADGHAGVALDVVVREGLVTDGVQASLEEGLAVAGTVVRLGTTEPVAGARVYLLALEEEVADASQTPAELRRADRSARREERRASREERRQQRRESRLTREQKAQVAFVALKAARKAGGVLETTDADGYFKLREVPYGRYRLIVDHDEFLPASEEIVIDDSSVVTDLRIDLDVGETLTGSVELTGGEPGAGVTVILRSVDGVVRRTQTDELGRYEVTGLLEGRYSFLMRVSGVSVAERQKVTIDTGENRFDFKAEN